MNLSVKLLIVLILTHMAFALSDGAINGSADLGSGDFASFTAGIAGAYGANTEDGLSMFQLIRNPTAWWSLLTRFTTWNYLTLQNSVPGDLVRVIFSTVWWVVLVSVFSSAAANSISRLIGAFRPGG